MHCDVTMDHAGGPQSLREIPTMGSPCGYNIELDHIMKLDI